MASEQYIFEETHIYNADPKGVFPLMCPVREADYMDGWEYEMIYSESGLIELGCAFSTPYHRNEKTIWTVSLYDPASFVIELTRFTPELEVVTISIFLKWLGSSQTEAMIRYVHTPISEVRGNYLATEYAKEFNVEMAYWENALNHYLATGERLKR